MPSRKTLANAIRALSMDAVQRANSGHPGAPMGMADLAEVLYNDFMRHNPVNPQWPNRDRFVMSNGHGSMLPYSVLHLTGYDFSMDDIRNFRQLHSKSQGTPNTVTPRVSRPPPGPWARELPMPWVWRLPSAYSRPASTRKISRSLITTPMCSPATGA